MCIFSLYVRNQTVKILAICPRIPEEGKKGDQVLSFHRLCFLARNHKIKLICFGNIDQDFEAKAKLESVGICVVLIKWRALLALVNIFLATLKFNTPFQCALFKSANFKKALQDSFVEFAPDAIYAVTVRVIENINSCDVPLFIDLVDSMALNFSRNMENSGGLKRFLLNMEYKRVKEYEKKVAILSKRSFVVSSVDQQIIGCDKVSVIPLGIDTNVFYKERIFLSQLAIIFTGNMNYKPNVDAVLWFYNQCWVKLKITIPELRFVIAGSNPTSEVIKLRKDDSVTVTGRVPSLAELINRSTVAVAPMQSGSGMQFKILEAMACGVPVVTTELGLGDIRARVGSEILVANSANLFIEYVLLLLKSKDLCQKIGDAGRHYAYEHHTWDVLNSNFENSVISTIS